MNRPVRLFLPLCLVLLAATSRCSCLTATSSTGACEGQVGGVDISGPLDAESEHHTLYRAPDGTVLDQTVLNLSCARGLLKVRGKLDRITVFGGPHTLGQGCKPTVNDGGTGDAGTADAGTTDAGTTDAGSGSCEPAHDPSYPSALEWEVIAPTGAPVLVTGLVTAALRLDESIDGTVTMEFADGTKATIRYNAYHEDSLDVGSPPSSGSGDSDSD